MINRAWVIEKASEGHYHTDSLRMEEPVPGLAPGEVRLRTVYLSLDPTSRNWLKLDPVSTYLPLAVGDVMRGVAVSVVEESRSPQLQPGDAVTGLLHWETHSVVPATQVSKVDRALPLETYLTIFSHIGLAAAIGILEIGALKPTDTVVVSGAAGATGSLAAQIALARGARVIGITGGESKRHLLLDELGLTAAIDYKAENVSAALERECPNGVDLFFDNVGGAVLDAVLENLAIGARIAICGAISQYDLGTGDAGYGCKNLPLLMFRRARMEGFVVPQFESRLQEFIDVLGSLYAQGKLTSRPHIVDGIEAAPGALKMLFSGGNNGKLIVQLSSPNE
jgi:NADPH-dependent curcumin reductase CurA